MPSVKFYLNHPDKKKPATIIAKINVNGKRFAVATGERIEPKYWNPKTQHVRPSYRGSIEINQALEDFAYAFMQVWRVNRTATAQEIRQKFLALVSVEEKTLFPVLEQFIEQCRAERDEKTAKKYASLKGILYEFNPYLTFQDLDMHFHDGLRAFLYLRPNYNYPNSKLVNKGDYWDIVEKKGSTVGIFDETVTKYFVNLKTFLRWAKKRGHEVPTVFETWKTPKGKPQPITLSIAELEKLESAPLTGKVAIARDYLVFECRTGQRISDVKRFNLKDFDGQSWTFYPRKGNRLGKKKVTVHFTGYCEKALSILQKYNFQMPPLSEQKINENIKTACKEAGINTPTEIFRTAQNKRIRIAGPKYEFISTHTGRKTFITIALQFMSPTSVMQLAGIDSYSTLKHYEGDMDSTIVREALKEVERGIMKAG